MRKRDLLEDVLIGIVMICALVLITMQGQEIDQLQQDLQAETEARIEYDDSATVAFEAQGETIEALVENAEVVADIIMNGE